MFSCVCVYLCDAWELVRNFTYLGLDPQFLPDSRGIPVVAMLLVRLVTVILTMTIYDDVIEKRMYMSNVYEKCVKDNKL